MNTPLKLTLVAAALNLATTAMAQSDVTISGWLNLGVQKVTENGTKLGTVQRSNIAFSGTEDLGNGLAATFKLSTRFEMNDGATEAGGRPFWQGESTVGLKGSFGSIRLGRALSPINNLNGPFESWEAFDRIASPGWWYHIPDFLSDPRDGLPNDHEYSRISNAIFYDSPDMGGVSVHLSTAASDSRDNRARHYGVSLNYDSGPLSLMLGGEQNSQRDRAYFLGAAYKFDGFKLMAAYSHVKFDTDGSVWGAGWTNWAAASDPKTKRTTLVLSATIDAGPGAVLLGVGRDFQGATNGFNYIGSSFTNAGTNYSGPSNFFGATYLYNLSKRTSIFLTPH